MSTKETIGYTLFVLAVVVMVVAYINSVGEPMPAPESYYYIPEYVEIGN